MSKKPSPFTHVNEIYKVDGTFDDEAYAQYIVNKELSKNGSLIDLVNTVQQYSLLNELHFKVMNSFFPYSKRPGFKQFPWIWKGKKEHKEEVEVLAKYYNESTDNAQTYYDMLMSSKEGKEHIKYLMEIYGKKNVR